MPNCCTFWRHILVLRRLAYTAPLCLEQASIPPVCSLMTQCYVNLLSDCGVWYTLRQSYLILPLCTCALVYTCIMVLIRMHCTYKFASQIPLALYYLSFLLSAQHTISTQICVEPLWVSEDKSERLIRILFQAEQPESKAHQRVFTS